MEGGPWLPRCIHENLQVIFHNLKKKHIAGDYVANQWAKDGNCEPARVPRPTLSLSCKYIYIYICIIITMIIIIINNNNINIHIYIHATYIPYITLHYIYITLNYIYITFTLHYITLHYITLHYITLHYIHTCTCICASHSNDHWSWCWINLFKIASFPFVVPQCQTFCSTAGMLFFWPPTNFGTIRASRT